MPTITYRAGHPDGLSLDVMLFGNEERTLDWSARVLRDAELAQEHPEQTKRILSTIDKVASVRSVRTVIAPSVIEFNAAAFPYEEFDTPIELPFENTTKLFHGPKADGVVVPRNTKVGVYLSPADCPTVVMMGKNGWAVGHAGRDSLLKPDYPLSNIVFSLCQTMNERLDESPHDIFVRVYLGIEAKHFSHPISHKTHGAKNAVLRDFIKSQFGSDCLVGNPDDVCIDLFEVIRQSCDMVRIPLSRIECRDFETFSNTEKWWSARRGEMERNGVLVMPSRVC